MSNARTPAVAVLVTALAACGQPNAPSSSNASQAAIPSAPEQATSSQSPAQSGRTGAPTAAIANPASTHCVDVGGRLVIEETPRGAQYGVCLFEDNRQCEEWALLRDECPVGGRKVTGYATAAARYCAITGGHYVITANSGSASEQGTCALPSGKVCAADAYLNGDCTR